MSSKDIRSVGVDHTVLKQAVLDLTCAVSAIHLGYQWNSGKKNNLKNLLLRST